MNRFIFAFKIEIIVQISIKMIKTYAQRHIAQILLTYIVHTDII